VQFRYARLKTAFVQAGIAIERERPATIPLAP
jgi:hypothetical protein